MTVANDPSAIFFLRVSLAIISARSIRLLILFFESTKKSLGVAIRTFRGMPATVSCVCVTNWQLRDRLT